MADRKDELLRILRTQGPKPGGELCRLLGISQPTLSRTVSKVANQVLIFGRARATRYASRRPLAGVAVPTPLYEVEPGGGIPQQVARLHPVEPAGYCVEGWGSQEDRIVDDLPWYLQDLRPGGFLGRLLARQLADQGYPADPRFWSADQVLRFASTHGNDLPGGFLLGRESYHKFIDTQGVTDAVHAEDRPRAYAELAESVLTMGPGGSSAAGEQPKFLAIRREETGLTPVLVKFSPGSGTAVAQRVADLLVAERLALNVVSEAGLPVPSSQLIRSDSRVFLEVERFDRVGRNGRRGQVTLASLDGEFVGSALLSWTESVESLAALGIVPSSAVAQVRWLSLFGKCIGNSDMHFGNLAFLLSGTTVTGLAPVYDMLPMHYFPRHEVVPDGLFEFPPVYPGEEDWSAGPMTSALSYWHRLAASTDVSSNFAALAARNARRLQSHARKWHFALGHPG